MGSSTIEAPSAEAEAEAKAALDTPTSVGDLSIGALVALVSGGDTPADMHTEAVNELESRADDGIEEAAAALRELGHGEPPIEGALTDADRPTGTELEAAGLPTSADDDGGDVDLSEGIDLQIPGLEGGLRLSFSGIGGKRPEESELRVVGGAFKVPGQFEKGQDVNVELRLRVVEVGFADVLDNKTAQAVTSKRKHRGRVLGAVVIDRSAQEKLAELVDGFSVGTIPVDEVRRILGIKLGGEQTELGAEPGAE